MDLDKLLNDHYAVKQEKGYGEKHHDISIRFAIELLKELEKKSFSMYYQYPKVIKLIELESLRLELEMQLNNPHNT